MLQQVDLRRISLGLSVRQLAKQLDIAPSLLSMVLNGKKEASKNLTRYAQTLDADIAIEAVNKNRVSPIVPTVP